MDIIIYNELDTAKIVGFKKLYTYLLNDDFISMTISNIIVKYIENIIYPEEIYKNDAEIYITSNLEAKNIIKYEHPKNIICTHF